jgi:hypothetical protein
MFVLIMKKKYPVILSDTERDQLKNLIAAGTALPASLLTLASCSKPTKARRVLVGSMSR